jgi:Ca2+-transporting ATPase
MAMTDNRPPEWQTLSAREAASAVRGDLENGLSNQEARERLERSGPNALSGEKKESFWEEFFEELREPMVLLLLVTGVLYAVWGELADAITIFVIILALNTIEVVNEQRSKKAIASLHKMAEPMAAVLRAGHYVTIPAEDVVPGDLLAMQAGHRVPADARLVESSGLAVDESALTGEAVPAEKEAEPRLESGTPLAERRNMVYASTLVSRGKGTALAVSTGMQTEIGRIAGLARGIKEPRTPLQGMMDELSRTLVWIALGFSVLIPLAGIFLAGQPPKQMVLTGLSLAFATIPEEMPIIITMVLALGAFRLSKQHAIARRLKAVETLGAVTVIATDKTGTLTENRMEVSRFDPAEAGKHILETGILSNDAVPDGDGFAGDPVDAALLQAAQKAGIDVKTERRAQPILDEFPFDNGRKRMSAVYMKDGENRSAVKGAPEAVLARCTQQVKDGDVLQLTEEARQSILDEVARMAADGLRVLAFAERRLPDKSSSQEMAESELTFIGLAGLQDPPRPEARQAIATCQQAGVRAIMITGDHPLTARAIAQQVGLDGRQEVITGPELDRLTDEELREVIQRASIFARSTPEHKLRIVQALQSQGERVAVTGDGVNDAPALSAADIGVAMGESGTDVAREAGDLVLTDDNFSTIVRAVEEGRLIYENLKKGVSYYLACKLALVSINLVPVLLLVPVPFAPVQIILMELFMDLMAAASFVAEKAEADLLKQKPRDPRAKFMDKEMTGSIASAAMGLFAAVTFVYLFTWYSTGDQTTSQTAAFFAWLSGHVLLAYNMRSERQPIVQMGLFSNRMMVIWAVTVAAFMLAVSLIPAARQLVKITTLNSMQWGLVLAAAAIGTFWIEVRKLVTFRETHR